MYKYRKLLNSRVPHGWAHGTACAPGYVLSNWVAQLCQDSCSLSQGTQASRCSWSSPSGSSSTWRRKGGCDALRLQLKAKGRGLVSSALWVISYLPRVPYACVQGVPSDHVSGQCCKVQGKVSFQKWRASLVWRRKLSTDSLKHMDLFLFFLSETGFWGCIYHATQARW